MTSESEIDVYSGNKSS